MTPRVLRAGGLPIVALCAAVTLQASRPATLGPSEPVPPQRLADTGLYLGGRIGEIDPRNRAFAPQYSLWSDGLAKKRWVYLPAGSTIDARDALAWTFPVGTRFWKEFSLGTRKVETRMLWKASAQGWIYASYAWNADGSDATLVPGEGLFGVADVAPGRQHSIPSNGDCAACHGNPATGGPLGFNLLQLSNDRDPNAIHGEPLKAGMLTLADLVGDGLLTGARADVVTRPPRIKTESPATRSMLGYLAANCSMCHNGKGEIAALGPVIRYSDLLEDGDALARGFIKQATRWQVPGEADGASVLVHPGNPERSAMFVRMRSRSPSSQMPPLGTVVRDQAAVDALSRWISTELMRAH